MFTVILQIPATFETRQIRTAAMLTDGICTVNSTLDRLPDFSQLLQAGALPVGSVEFVRAAMGLAGLREPINISYPLAAQPYLKREVSKVSALDARSRGPAPSFIKPVETKLFTGFVHDCNEPLESHSEHVLEQRQAFYALPLDALVWISSPVVWSSEWRYYVQDGQVKGAARYDEGEGADAPIPDLTVVLACIKELCLAHPYAIDFGVLGTGQTALVEVNDAWAIGLYGGALLPRDYFNFLHERWVTLKASSLAS